MRNIVEKNEDIQFLRAVAILITLVAHIGVLTKVVDLEPLHQYFEYWGGVDLFFCISGFVITRSLLRGYKENYRQSEKIIALYQFWIKRAFRIIPSAWLWLLIAVSVSAGMNLDVRETTTEVYRQALIAFFNLFNFMHPNCMQSDGWHCQLVGVYWSLSLEEQFYILFPAIFFFVKHRRICIAIGALLVVLFFQHRPWPDLGWSLRVDPICFGVLLAFFHSTPFARLFVPTLMLKKLNAFIFFAVVVLLVLSVPKLSPSLGGIIFPFETGLIAVVCSVMVFVASYDLNVFIPSTKDREKKVHLRFYSVFFLWVGSRSYSIYLVHIIVFTVIRNALESDSFVRTGGGFVCFAFVSTTISFVVAELNYRFVEMPFRVKGRDLAEKTLL
jgi:peptidoglycan/LPS O-acetylase OafA/YrhL